ncbi:MAG: hypothetical protein K9H16_02040, partial [Bacteroidales bacterium]|nr:hypothetical protein [Bacteroidales bacterium]
SGGENVSPDAFVDYKNVFFTIKPNSSSEKEYFKDSDMDEWFSGIKLFQEGNEIQLAAPASALRNAEGKIDRVLLSYKKNDIKLYQPIVFINAIDTSAALNLQDKYFTHYFKYLPIYEESMQWSDKRNYIETYSKAMRIVEDSKKREEVKYFSFYDHTSDILLPNAIVQQADTMNKLMMEAGEDFKQNTSKAGLYSIDSMYLAMKDVKEVFSPYFEMEEPKSEQCLETFDQMLEKGGKIREDSHKRYKAMILSFLETGDYSNYKFSLFIDVLAKMTTHLDTLKTLGDLNKLDLTLLDGMPQIMEELKTTNWLNDFQTLVEMLNSDIEARGKLFGEAIIQNLQRLKATEHQPYLQIFLAFNELSENKSLFVSYLKNALIYCTDENMILNLEMWILSYNLTNENLSASIICQINKGITLVEQENWTDAANTFGTITKLANTIAPPWFFLGKIQFMQGEVFAAGAKFSRALDIYPEYIAPRMFNFSLLNNQENYKELLSEIDDAILINDIWLYHFYKARALFMLKHYDEAVVEITEHCQNLNPFSLDQFFLLGDCYMASQKYDLAKQAYEKTQEIDIYTSESLFNVKMQELLKSRN